MADYKKFSLRLDYDNPEHDKIITAIENVDKRKFKNKTQFIICALKHYVDFLNVSDGEQLLKERMQNLNQILITRREFEDKISIIKGEIKSELYEDMISLLKRTGSNDLGMLVSADNNTKEQNVESALSEDDLSKYEGIMDSVMSWSEHD